MTTIKEQGLNISLAAILSWIPLVPIMWFVVQPILVTAVSEAMADEIQIKIETSVKPLNTAFMVLIRSDITEVRKEIAAMKFRRDNPPVDDWTDRDAEDLVDLELEFEGLNEALAELQGL